MSATSSTIRGRLMFAADSARAINPIGAAIIFALAWLAGFAGSFAALLVAAALLGGLYLAKQSAEISAPVNPPAAPVIIPAAAVHPSSGACGPSISEAIANGLQIRKIEFAGPPAVKVRKVAAPVM